MTTRYQIQPSVLRAIRISKGLSVMSMSTACDVHEATYRKWEDGSATPTGRDIIGMCRMLKTYPRMLFAEPTELMFKHVQDVVLTEVFKQIEEMAAGQAPRVQNDELMKMMEKLRIFEEADFSFEDKADLMNEAHNQVADHIP